MGKVIVFGVGGLVAIGLLFLAIVLIFGLGPKLASLFWKKSKKEEKKNHDQITQQDPENPFSDARWHPDDWRNRV